MTREKAVAAARGLVGSGTFAGALGALVAIPSESQRPGRASALRAYLEVQERRLAGMGFDCRVVDNPVAGAPPVMIARRVEHPALPTVLIYGHGDVTHGQAGAWAEGRDPFVLTPSGSRLYGRGAADNKAQHLINLLALEAVLSVRGALGFNVTMLLEMAEEIGSPGLGALAAAERKALAADVFIASDGPRLQPDVPTLFMGARGVLNFDLSVCLRDGAHHSGNWGGLLADPAMILAQALATITDARGQIRVPEWRPGSLTPAVRAALAGLPLHAPGGPQIDEDWGEAALSPAERVFGWNAFAILAMTAGVPVAPQNAIAGEARATCQLRFVVGTEPDAILPALRRHLDGLGFGRVRIKGSEAAFPATRLDPEAPWAQFAIRSLARTAGRAPHVLPNLGGSLPNDVFAEVLGLPTVWIPHSYRACNQHAPDEHVLLPLCEEALGLMAGLWWDLGAGGTP
ncbi:MAG: M20 family metallopeptidase [Rhodobacteraceae bacterium]|nr:M20 family metallopeptidase [Paracoccaceae bacterium]